jgi:CheY-like chemotaxis protein
MHSGDALGGHIGRANRERLELVADRAELLRSGRWDGQLEKTRADGTRVVVASRWSLRRDEQGRPAAILVQETLAIDGISSHVTRVETEADFIVSLEQGGFDLILADYTLPSFDGLSALKIARQNWPHLPLIFVSGTLGEEVAIEALKIGATDYVFKTRLSRIVPSVQRPLREAKERIDLSRAQEGLRRSEAYLAEAQKLSHTGSFGWDVSSGKNLLVAGNFSDLRIRPRDRTCVGTYA